MSRKPLLLILVATVVLFAACTYGWRQWRLAHPDRSHVMTALTQNMRTHCVGRLLIDLPEDSTWGPNASGATIGGIKLAVETDMSHEQFKDYIEQRWQEIEAKKSSSKRYVQRPAERTSPWATVQSSLMASVEWRGLMWMGSIATISSMMPKVTTGTLARFSN